MHDPNKEEKLQAKEISLGGTVTKAEKPHGKLYRWLDNFWYHHKWKTIIISFFAVVILVCTLQMCRKEESGDIAILAVGPYSFVSEDSGLSDFQNCLGTYLPADFDGNGVKKVDVISYTVYSEEQIKAYQAEGIQMDTAGNVSAKNQFHSYMQTGECSILFLDPWLYEEVKANGLLKELQAQLGYTPEGGILTESEGKSACYGVRLGDTALYRENIAMQKLPADTVICIAAPVVTGKSGKEAEFAKAVDYFKALVPKEK